MIHTDDDVNARMQERRQGLVSSRRAKKKTLRRSFCLFQDRKTKAAAIDLYVFPPDPPTSPSLPVVADADVALVADALVQFHVPVTVSVAGVKASLGRLAERSRGV